ncbi:M56 family metallopeptidase [Streptacidiphilus sp. PB12-B1b]|uniref:M56 family metallopeptidase n=1 Tax=Streptacidiphilus sp. PB12-B1b TaxID=2705012 RepID=UPI0015F9DC44|nr:M56 family metallopeptidase [Streptacidiphilus sp. PB12-B1b]QMU74693.1 M56 family metallopeptidase [Streptacidiphilus sp. PB12-B1b]
MRIDVYLLLLAPVLFAWLGPPLVGWLSPAAAARTLTALSVLAACSVLWALVVLCVGGLSRTSGLQYWLHSNQTALAASDPVPRKVGILAVVLLGFVLLHLAVAVVRRARGVRAVARVVVGLTAAGDLLILDDQVPDAYAVPGGFRRPGRIVVTTGMLGSLKGEERLAVLAHERSHLAHRHHIYLAVAQMAVCLCPCLGRVATRIAFVLERWADEDAADVVGDRPLAARALARAALAVAESPDGGAHGPGRPALAYVGLRVSARVEALRTERTVSRWSAVWPVLGVLLLTACLFSDVTSALAHCFAVIG